MKIVGKVKEFKNKKTLPPEYSGGKVFLFNIVNYQNVEIGGEYEFIEMARRDGGIDKNNNKLIIVSVKAVKEVNRYELIDFDEVKEDFVLKVRCGELGRGIIKLKGTKEIRWEGFFEWYVRHRQEKYNLRKWIKYTLEIDGYKFKKEIAQDTNTPVWEVYPEQWEELEKRRRAEEEKLEMIKGVMKGEFVEDINILYEKGLEEIKVGNDIILKFGPNFIYWDELGCYVNEMKKTDSRLVIDIINYYRFKDINYLLHIDSSSSKIIWADYYENISEGGAIEQDKYPFNRHRTWRRDSREKVFNEFKEFINSLKPSSEITFENEFFRIVKNEKYLFLEMEVWDFEEGIGAKDNTFYDNSSSGFVVVRGYEYEINFYKDINERIKEDLIKLINQLNKTGEPKKPVGKVIKIMEEI